MIKSSISLPNTFTPMYADLLHSTKSILVPRRRYCGFAPRFGRRWNGGLMFYGRAANGWIRESEFSAEQLASDQNVNAVAAQLVQSADTPICGPCRETDVPEPYRMREDPNCCSDPMHWDRHDRK